MSNSRVPAVLPMHPTLVRARFHRSGWVCERKEDGWRMLAYKDGAAVRLVSRRGVDHTARFGDIAAVVAEVQYNEMMQGRLRDPVLRSLHATRRQQQGSFDAERVLVLSRRPAK